MTIRRLGRPTGYDYPTGLSVTVAASGIATIDYLVVAGGGAGAGQNNNNGSGGGGVVLMPHQVIMRPLVTEKGVHRSNRNNQYAFEINPLATKDNVRDAVQELFNVKVLKVRTQNRKGKVRRHRFRDGQTKKWKRAIVTLAADNRIDFF